MSKITEYSQHVTRFIQTALIFSMIPATASGIDSRFDIRTEAMAEKPSPQPPAGRKKTRKQQQKVGNEVYVVRRGDFLFRILLNEYGYSYSKALSAVPEIKRLNNINDINKIKVGQKLVIPSHKSVLAKRSDHSRSMKSSEIARAIQYDKLQHSEDPVFRLRLAWQTLMPSNKDLTKFNLSSERFSVKLDPGKFPSFSTMAGGSIILDQNASLSPALVNMIQKTDPAVKVVTGGALPFETLKNIVFEAGFFSVEESPYISFGTGPILTVRPELQIEKTPESFVNSDVNLLHTRTLPYPKSIKKLLRQNGFFTLEPFAVNSSNHATVRGRLIILSKTAGPDLLDKLMNGLSLPYQPNRTIELNIDDSNPVTVTINTDRYLEYRGKKIAIFSGNNKSSLEGVADVLKEHGYSTMVISPADTMQSILKQLLHALSGKADFGKHVVGFEMDSPFSVSFDGARIQLPQLNTQEIFITESSFEQPFFDALNHLGYSVDLP